jgi:hypothetical protein
MMLPMQMRAINLNPSDPEIMVAAPPDGTLTSMAHGTAVLAPVQWLHEINATGVKPGELSDVLEALKNQEAEEDSAGYRVSLRKDMTGVDNTIFVSTKGSGRHAPRIKIAIDPPNSFNETCTSASMAVHDFSIIGTYVSPRLVEQAKAFIERNRDVLLSYWNSEFDTGELFTRLRRP